MSVWGKVLGAGAGFALGGPLGALVGAAAGHYIAKFRANALSAEQGGRPSSVGHESQQARQVIFATALVVLAVPPPYPHQLPPRPVVVTAAAAAHQQLRPATGYGCRC